MSNLKYAMIQLLVQLNKHDHVVNIYQINCNQLIPNTNMGVKRIICSFMVLILFA